MRPSTSSWWIQITYAATTVTPPAFIFSSCSSHSRAGYRVKWNSPDTGNHGRPPRVR